MLADKIFFDKLRQQIEEMPEQKIVEADTDTRNSVPDILQLMQDINSGKKRYADVDWGQQIKTMLTLCSMMPTHFPYIIWLWGLLGAIDDPTTRMDIIGKMQAAAPDCFEDLNERQLFISDCSCVYQICVQARAYNLRNDIGIREMWTDERKSLNDLAHILSDKVVDAKLMVALAEEMYRTSQEHENQYMLTLVLRAPRSIGQLTIDNIVDFAKNLYIAEGFRQLILQGKENSLDVPTIDEFNWEIRNACFDVYIDLRKEQIKTQLNRINRRVKGASEIDCLKQLLKEESAVVNRENGLEQFQGSPAYNAMWYPGRQIVLDMLNIFIEYLELRIEDEENAASKSTPSVINIDGAVEQIVAKVQQAITGQNAQPAEPMTETPKEPEGNGEASELDSSFFAISEKITYEACEKELLRCIRTTKTKAAACREILTSAHVYFILSDKTNQEIADAINPWVARAGKDYVFSEDDFRKARKKKLT